MAENTIVDKAGATVGVGIAMASDVAGAIKTAIGGAMTAMSDVLKNEPAKKTAAKKPAKKSAAKKAVKKASAKKAAKKAPAKKAAKKAPAKKGAKETAARKTVAKKGRKEIREKVRQESWPPPAVSGSRRMQAALQRHHWRERFIAASRTPPWLDAGSEDRGRRPSRVRRSPGMLFWLSLSRLQARNRAPFRGTKVNSTVPNSGESR